MARNRSLPHVGEDFSSAPEPPSAEQLVVADAIYESFQRDPDPAAYFEMVKRTDPKAYYVMLTAALAIKAQHTKAATSHSRAPLAAISPIRPGIIDVPSGS